MTGRMLLAVVAAAVLAAGGGVGETRAAAPSKCVGEAKSPVFSIQEPQYAAGYGAVVKTVSFSFAAPLCARLGGGANYPIPQAVMKAGDFTWQVYVAGTTTPAPEPIFGVGQTDWGTVLMPDASKKPPAGCQTVAASVSYATNRPTSTGSDGPVKQIYVDVKWSSPVANTGPTCGAAPAGSCTCRTHGPRTTQGVADDCPQVSLASTEQFAKSIDTLADSLKAHAHSYVAATREKDFDGQMKKADALVAQLKAIAELVTQKDSKVTPAQRQAVLQNAVISLAGALAGDKYKGDDLADSVNAALTYAQKSSNSDTQRRQALTSQIKKVVTAAVAGSGVNDKELQAKFGEFAGQLTTLGTLAFGNPTDEEREAMFKQAVIGLLERTVFDGLLDASWLKAATTGYDLGKPFGDFIAKNLATVLNTTLLTAAGVALHAADPNWRANLDDGTKTSVKGTIAMPTEFGGWTVTAYKDGCKTMIQILGAPKGVLAHAFGKHDDAYLVGVEQIPN